MGKKVKANATRGRFYKEEREWKTNSLHVILSRFFAPFRGQNSESPRQGIVSIQFA